jgi:23S rRNA (cytosine1962-C5)-methyltransferase
VVVVDPSGASLGTAHYSDSSQITLRLLSERVETIDREFYLRRIAAAEAHRKRVVTDSEAYRLIHGEGDQLPGLVIDRYGDYLTLQTLDQGMDRAKAEIVSCLEELFAPQGLAERNDVAVRKLEALPLQSGVLAGEVPETVAVRMNGLKLYADLLHGQKTGFSSISGKIISRQPGMAEAGLWTVSHPPADSRCIWRRSARAWRPWTVRKRRSGWLE